MFDSDNAQDYDSMEAEYDEDSEQDEAKVEVKENYSLDKHDGQETTEEFDLNEALEGI